MYRVFYKKSVERDLRRLDKPVARRILDSIETGLAADPLGNPVLRGQFAGLRRCRVGDFRIVYAILGDDIVILRVSHRKDVYRSKG